MKSATLLSSSARSGRRAFTLIELLTVIAIIGVLMAILFPVIGRVRESSSTTRCASNLRQVGIAIQSYVTENRGTLPPTGFFGVSSYYNRDPRNFQNSLLGYLDLKPASSWSTAVENSNYSPMFDCKSYKGAVGGKGYVLANNVADIDGVTVKPWGTMSNAQGSLNPAPKKLVSMPAQQWALRDSDATEGGSHPGYQNALYFDGRVGRLVVNN